MAALKAPWLKPACIAINSLECGNELSIRSTAHIGSMPCFSMCRAC